MSVAHTHTHTHTCKVKNVINSFGLSSFACVRSLFFVFFLSLSLCVVGMLTLLNACASSPAHSALLADEVLIIRSQGGLTCLNDISSDVSASTRSRRFAREILDLYFAADSPNADVVLLC